MAEKKDMVARALTWIISGLLVMELLAAIDTTGVTVMVPALQNYFNIPPQFAGWILLAYLVPFTVFMVPIGWYADKIGQPEKILIGSILGFGLMSLGCSLSPSIEWLIFFRFLKGICAAAMFTTEFAIIIKYWQKPWPVIETVVIGLGVGVLVGPIIGGLFANTMLWRYFFLLGTGFATFGFIAYHNIKKLKPVEREVDLHDQTRDLPVAMVAEYLYRMLAWGVVLNVSAAFAMQGINLIITLHVQETLGKSATFNSLILATVALGMIISNATQFGSKVIKNLTLAAWGSATAVGLLIGVLSLINTWVDWFNFPVYLLFGFFAGIILSTVEQMYLRKMPTSRLAISNGILVTAMQLGYVIASGIVPFLYLRTGADTGFILAFIVLAVVTFYLVAHRRS